MSKNNKNKPVFPRIDPDSDNIKSEAAKEFSFNSKKDTDEDGYSQGDVDKNVRVSVESQLFGIPVRTKKENKKK